MGQLTLSPVPTEIVALVRRVTSTMGGQAWRQGKVQVVLETADSEVWAMADGQRLAQVLVSLLHDAVRHTLPGGVVVVSVENQPDAAIIRVQETSEGIHLDPQSHAGEPSHWEQRQAGLSMVRAKALVKAMGGTLTIENARAEDVVTNPISERRLNMKEQRVNQKPEKIIVIDVTLTRGLALVLAAALLLAAVLGTLMWGQQQVAASSPQAPASSAGMRQYYLTTATYNGGWASGTDGNGAGICAPGYHFASMWEIIDPSNLKYNADFGYTTADRGQGPPAGVAGWIRTGYISTSSSTPGVGNCYNWTSSSVFYGGTLVQLDTSWDTAEGLPGWYAQIDTNGCAANKRVWCVED